MLRTIAWRNIWRNPRRSAMLISAIAVGTFCFLGATAFLDGMAQQMITSTIGLQGGHIQVAPAGYHSNPGPQARIATPEPLLAALEQETGLAYTPRIVRSGLASSAERSTGIIIYGIEPEHEDAVIELGSKIVEGTLLDEDPTATQSGLVIGQALAEYLDLRLGEKAVLLLNDVDNEIQSAAYRVTGIYQTANKLYDKATVYVPLAEAQRLTGLGTSLTTISIHLEDASSLEPVAQRLRQVAPEDVEVLTWKERLPFLVMTMQMYDYSVAVLVLILFTAVAFSIINSFLMVILERIHELGIMMANGVRPRQIRHMLFLEALFVALLGLTLGTVLATPMLAFWKSEGLDLSQFGDGLRTVGIDTVIYPYLDPFHLVLGTGLILLIVLLAVLYPAYRASRYGVVAAINHV